VPGCAGMIDTLSTFWGFNFTARWTEKNRFPPIQLQSKTKLSALV